MTIERLYAIAALLAGKGGLTTYETGTTASVGDDTVPRQVRADMLDLQRTRNEKGNSSDSNRHEIYTGQQRADQREAQVHEGIEAWSEHVGQKVVNAMETLFGTPIICPVLIGRATDLATLHLLIDQAKGGRGGYVALISGEAGIGKSRLVAEAKTYAAAHNFLLLQGNCFPTDFSCPYAPVLDLLRSSAASQLAATITSDLAPFTRELYHLLPDVVSVPPDLAPLSTPDPEQQKRRLFTALAQFFTGQATKQPVLLVIEDIHWSDETSLEFLHYLARRCPASPCLSC